MHKTQHGGHYGLTRAEDVETVPRVTVRCPEPETSKVSRQVSLFSQNIHYLTYINARRKVSFVRPRSPPPLFLRRSSNGRFLLREVPLFENKEGPFSVPPVLCFSHSFRLLPIMAIIKGTAIFFGEAFFKWLRLS